MYFPTEYKVLKLQKYEYGEYSIVPIRYEDRWDIMKWRNEQIFHLRQEKELKVEDQENYFHNVIPPLFSAEKPDQILFSFLKNDACMGYGGMVHINWKDRHAEVSFLMNTQLEKEYFESFWSIFLQLLEKVAFEDCGLRKLFTYAFDIRPILYPVIEKSGFIQEAVLKDHCWIERQWKDVVIHSKINYDIIIRKAGKDDMMLIFEWANDVHTRKNSFQPRQITLQEHTEWFTKRNHQTENKDFIALVDGLEAAYIRFDVVQKHEVISINLNPSCRGKNLATKLLINVLKAHIRNKEIWAYIKPSNTASIKVFERAGFVFDEETLFRDQEARIYKMKTNVT
ncbi:MAG: GNAT family N-acetyltransferase [Saprospiraceae bacterium]